MASLLGDLHEGSIGLNYVYIAGNAVVLIMINNPSCTMGYNRFLSVRQRFDFTLSLGNALQSLYTKISNN